MTRQKEKGLGSYPNQIRIQVLSIPGKFGHEFGFIPPLYCTEIGYV